MKRFILAACSLVAFAPVTSAQTIDCAASLSAGERAICDSRVMRRLDHELSDVYEDVLAQASERDRERIRNDQLDWKEMRHECGVRYDCLKSLYRDRISELEDRYDPGRRTTRSGDASDGRNLWAALGSVDVGDDPERATILVGFSRGRFNALQLRVRHSRTRIRRLTVVYASGTAQRFRFRRTFGSGELSSVIDLGGRGFGRFIERVIIEAWARDHAQIDVIARRSERRYRDPRPYARDRGPYPYDEDRYAELDERRFEDRGHDRRDGYEREFDERGRYEDRRDRYEDRRDRYGEDPYPGRGRVSAERLSRFVKEVFHRTAEMSASELRQTYAPRVDYYGEQQKSVEDVIRDKRDYANRWQDRAFRVRDETFRAEETDRPGVYEVTYNYDFHVRGNGRESRGYGMSTLLVDTNTERYVILKEDGKVLKRY